MIPNGPSRSPSQSPLVLSNDAIPEAEIFPLSALNVGSSIPKLPEVPFHPDGIAPLINVLFPYPLKGGPASPIGKMYEADRGTGNGSIGGSENEGLPMPLGKEPEPKLVLAVRGTGSSGGM